MNTLYLFSIVLILVIASTYLVHRSRAEKEPFEDAANTFFGILPKDKHASRIRNIMYYNDPMFIKYNDNYVMLTANDALGTKKTALTQIVYASQNKSTNRLTPISYLEPLQLKVFPDNDFNKKFNMEFEIVPYTRPINNQQPYLQIDDIVTFKTKNGEYLTIHPITKQLQLVVSKTVPNNGIFILSNSPQCYTNYVKYGIDTRNQTIGTLHGVMANVRKELDKKIRSLDKDEGTIRDLKKKEVSLKEAIEKADNNKDQIETDIRMLKADYENTLTSIRDKNSTIKLDINKDFSDRIELAENVIDSNYLQMMKETLDKGCSA